MDFRDIKAIGYILVLAGAFIVTVKRLGSASERIVVLEERVRDLQFEVDSLSSVTLCVDMDTVIVTNTGRLRFRYSQPVWINVDTFFVIPGGAVRARGFIYSPSK